MVGGTSPYVGREQAWVKHQVLRRYLESLALKVGGFRPGTTLNYIDGFSGPWDAELDDFGDSSPVIAMRQLAAAKTTLGKQGKEFAPRAMFVEENAKAFDRLRIACANAPVTGRAFNGSFEDHIDDAVRFGKQGPNPFAFVFIDPTGWTGFALPRIAPLLRVRPSEVLINFMWGHIGRFVENERPAIEGQFEDLFGEDTTAHRARWHALHGPDREDDVVRTYCACVRKVGGFAHCVSTVIVKPTSDRTHYHLVFATRSLKGLTTFREIERRVAPLQQGARVTAKQRKEEKSTGQASLFPAEEIETDPYLRSLEVRYRSRARAEVEERLLPGRDVPYDEVVALALGSPLTSEADLKGWLQEWSRAGQVRIVGLEGRERSPKIGAGHVVRRVG